MKNLGINLPESSWIAILPAPQTDRSPTMLNRPATGTLIQTLALALALALLIVTTPGFAAQPDLPDSLLEALTNGDSKLAKQRIKAGDDLHTRNLAGQTPLHLAVISRQKKVVKLLIEHNADVNAEDAVAADTPLHEAAGTDHQILKLLIEHGADLHKRNSAGLTPLHNAARRGDHKSVKLLLAQGANINASTDTPAQRSPSPLYLALHSRGLEMVALLLKRGADITQRAKMDASVLHSLGTACGRYRNRADAVWLEARQRCAEIAGLLIKKGADVSAKDHWGDTPVHRAALICNPELVQVLIESGGDINARANSGNTPLHYLGGRIQGQDDKPVVWRQCMETANVLMSSGARIDILNYAGRTPLGALQKIQDKLSNSDADTPENPPDTEPAAQSASASSGST